MSLHDIGLAAVLLGIDALAFGWLGYLNGRDVGRREMDVHQLLHDCKRRRGAWM
jgi:hypothetical protein